jgi:hypothetical protein
VSCRRETFCWGPGYFEARKTREQGRGDGHISGRGDPRGLIVGYRRAKRGAWRALAGGEAWLRERDVGGLVFLLQAGREA